MKEEREREYSSLRVVAGCIAIVNYVLARRNARATTIVVVAMTQRRKARGGFCAMHLRCIAAFARECDATARRIREEDQRPSASTVYIFVSARKAITLFTAAAVINSPGNRNFRRLCGWVEINCRDCRRAAMRVPRFARSIRSHTYR